MSDTPRLLGGRYEVGQLLGRGGMAEVHIGRDTRLGRNVAIKMLRADLARDQQFHKRFRREAQAAASLNHPAIVAVYDSGEDMLTEAGGASMPVPYIVMEYVEGRTVRDLLGVDSRLEWPEALRITSGVLAALEYSHRAGIVHRDIKPANVMLTPTGAVKVMDFGIARAVADTSATMTQTQAVIGTAQYLSPEQAKGLQVDARSDIYSTGCLLFELLTGRPPFVGDSPVSVAYQHVGEMPVAPSSLEPSVPPQVDAIVLHALAKDREARYQDAAGMRVDCEAVLAGRPISAEARGAVDAAAGAVLGAAAGAAVARPFDPSGLATEAIPYGGGATQAIPTTAGAPTYAGDPLGLGAGLGGDVSGDGPPTAAPPAGPPDKPNRTGIYVLLGLAVLAVLALLLVFGLHLTGGGTKDVAVPTVTTLTQDQANTALTKVGFVPKFTQAANPTVPKGSVVSQDPVGGVKAAPGSVVNVVVSSGPSSVQVPDVSGESTAKATADLKTAGLTVSSTNTVESAAQAAGTVITTNPPAGTTVDAGTGVLLNVASGKTTVPNVVGQQATSAVPQLTALGFKVKQVYAPSDEPGGQVTAQDHAGDELKRGQTVTLTVSNGTPTSTPSGTPTDTPSGTPTSTP